MAKNSVGDWDTTAGNNTDIGGIDISEGCAAANINNALREMMAQIQTGIGVDIAPYSAGLADDSAVAITGGTIDGTAIGGTTPAAGAFTTLTAANFVGGVMAFAMSTAPTGWLECNGDAVSRTTYAALFAAIGTTYGVGDGSTTFNLPELRGEFIRGHDNGRGVDSGRVFGSAQADALQGHEHAIFGRYRNTGTAAAADMKGLNAGGTYDGDQGTDGPKSDGVNGTPRTSAETRPRNIALMYCIKT